jgi:hypothetical protein
LGVRVGLIGDAERAAIVEGLRGLASYNETRHPSRPGSNYIGCGAEMGLSGRLRFALRHGLLTDSEVEILTREPDIRLPSEPGDKVEVKPWPVNVRSEVLERDELEPVNGHIRDYEHDGRRVPDRGHDGTHNGLAGPGESAGF